MSTPQTAKELQDAVMALPDQSVGEVDESPYVSQFDNTIREETTR